MAVQRLGDRRTYVRWLQLHTALPGYQPSTACFSLPRSASLPLPCPPPPCSKRPRRAASGGVLGAVAAEASEWGLEMVSPPLKRANSLPVRWVGSTCLPEDWINGLLKAARHSVAPAALV